MPAPAYEYVAVDPIRIGGVLGYAPGDLVPASVVEDHGLLGSVEARELLDTDQATADERVEDESGDDLPPSDSKA